MKLLQALSVINEKREILSWGGYNIELFIDPTMRELVGALTRFGENYGRGFVYEQERKPLFVVWDGHKAVHHDMIEALRVEWGYYHPDYEYEFSSIPRDRAARWEQFGAVWIRGYKGGLKGTSLDSFTRPEEPRLVEKFVDDRASQLGRAQQLGFDTSKVWYHGTTKRIAKFKQGNPDKGFNELGPGIYLATDATHAGTWAGWGLTPGGQMYPCFIRKGPVWDWDQFLMAPKDSIKREMLEPVVQGWVRFMDEKYSTTDATGKRVAGATMKNGWDRVPDLMRSPGESSNKLLRIAGFIGAVKHHSQVPTQIVVFRPEDIRSTFAKFKKPDGKLSETEARINEGSYPYWAGWWNARTEQVVQLGPREIHRDALRRLGVEKNSEGYIDLKDAFQLGWVRLSITKHDGGIPEGVAHGGSKIDVRKALKYLYDNHRTGGGIPWNTAWVEWADGLGQRTHYSFHNEEPIIKFINKGIPPRFGESLNEKFVKSKSMDFI